MRNKKEAKNKDISFKVIVAERRKRKTGKVNKIYFLSALSKSRAEAEELKMKKMIMDFLEEKGLYSPRLREQIANNALIIVGHRDVDKNIFCNWLSTLSVEGVRNIGSYFLTCFEKEIRLGHFDKRGSINEESASACISHSSAPQSAEEFEQSWEDWKRLLNELDPDDGIPSKGVLCQDDNTNVARAISDGDGGIVYMDGTLSERYPRFEDLDDENKRELSNACINLHRSAGYLERFKGLMEKIKPYETAS